MTCHPAKYRSIIVPRSGVRFTPDAVRKVLQQKNHHLALWYDPQHRKLGFAKDEPFCLIVELIGDQRFALQLIDMDRGFYRHEIEMMRPDGRIETVLSGAVGALEEVVKALEGWGLEVRREG